MKLKQFVFYFVLFAASTCFAQVYTVTDLGTLGGSGTTATAINNSGQVVGQSGVGGYSHAFRTEPNSPINPATDDLGIPGMSSTATAISDSGQVVGSFDSHFPVGYGDVHAFRTSPNSPINPATDDLGKPGSYSAAKGINGMGEVVGVRDVATHQSYSFRTAPNSPINPQTDSLGTFGQGDDWALGINSSGQVVGWGFKSDGAVHAFRTAANKAINPATDDVGVLSGTYSIGTAINFFGQVVGYSLLGGNLHAFRTAANSPINPATDDLGTLGGNGSVAHAINIFGEVVGESDTTGNTSIHPFIYSVSTMKDLNSLIPSDSGWVLQSGAGINDAGQIIGQGLHDGQASAFLLTPIYKAFVQAPINADGSSVFSAKRGVVPAKFSLAQNDIRTCSLPPATISTTRMFGGTVGPVDESTYLTQADVGSTFRIDPTACQYIYNLAASSLGVGTYRVDISIEGVMIGHAVFALK